MYEGIILINDVQFSICFDRSRYYCYYCYYFEVGIRVPKLAETRSVVLVIPIDQILYLQNYVLLGVR